MYYLSILLILTGLMNVKEVAAQPFEPTWESLKQYEVPEWFKDAKFGIYFHWGVYSVPTFGTEWYSRHMYLPNKEGWGSEVRDKHIQEFGKDFQYHEFIPQFTAEHFDAVEWAELFKKSGAKYAGPVAEHADNFSMWDSEVNSWNAAKMGPNRDIVGELEKAIKAEGLKYVTTFHHQWNWAWYPKWNGLVDTSTTALQEFYGEPTSAFTFDSIYHKPKKYGPSQKFVSRWKTKVYEVIDKYQPDLLWFDSRLYSIPEKDRQEMIARYYNRSVEWGKPVVLTYKNEDLPKDVAVFDIERGRMNKKADYSWLTDDAWDWSTWDYSSNPQYKDANHIVDGLIDIVSKNGCLLLNIGPKADGTIPEEIKDGLLEIGKWLDNNGQAIYGTRPLKTYGEGVTELNKNRYGGVNDEGLEYTPNDFRFTTKGSNLYIIQLGIPEPGKKFILKSFAQNNVAGSIKIKSLKLIGSKESIQWNKKQDGLHLTAPSTFPNDIALVYKAEIH